MLSSPPRIYVDPFSISSFNDNLTRGKFVLDFETQWSTNFPWSKGALSSLLVNSGSSAILVGLLALKYRLGDVSRCKLILPGLSWPTTVWASRLAGFEVEFADVNYEDWTIDWSDVSAMVRDDPAIVGVIINHTLGLPASSPPKDITDKGIIIVEDACAASPFHVSTRVIGSIGLFSCYSLFASHHMTSIEGGVLSSHDHEFVKLCRAISSHGWVRDDFLDDSDYPAQWDGFVFPFPGVNVRANEIQARLALDNLKRIASCNVKRVQLRREVIHHLGRFQYLIHGHDLNVPTIGVGVRCFSHDHRIRLIELLRKAGVQTRSVCGGKGLHVVTSRPLPNTMELSSKAFQIMYHSDHKIHECRQLGDLIMRGFIDYDARKD